MLRCLKAESGMVQLQNGVNKRRKTGLAASWESRTSRSFPMNDVKCFSCSSNMICSSLVLDQITTDRSSTFSPLVRTSSQNLIPASSSTCSSTWMRVQFLWTRSDILSRPNLNLRSCIFLCMPVPTLSFSVVGLLRSRTQRSSVRF